MGNVIDILTGEPIEGYDPKPGKEAAMLIEMLHQRRNQVQDFIVLWIENDPIQAIKWGCSPMSDIELKGLIEYLRECAKIQPEPDDEDDEEEDDTGE